MSEHDQPKLRSAIAELREEQPSLTARQVHEALLQLHPDTWAGLPLASVKKMCAKLTKAVAGRGGTTVADAPCSDAVDPSSLAAWPGLGFVPRTAHGSVCPPLEWSFQAAFPDSARVALSLGGDESAMDAYAQFVYSLFHGVGCMTHDCTCSACAVCLPPLSAGTLRSTPAASALPPPRSRARVRVDALHVPRRA